MPLQPGDPAPDITLPSHDREPVSLGDYRGRPLVVHFFPLAFSSTCAEQVCTVGEELGDYRDMNANVVAISVDSPYALARFREDCSAEFPFLSDFNREASEAFGVLREAPLGPGLRNVSDRAAFVIGPDGRVVYAWHAANPSLLPPFDEIRAAVQAL